jgi:hypothetical protein
VTIKVVGENAAYAWLDVCNSTPSQGSSARAELDVPVEMGDKPQERADVTPFALDHRPRQYVPELAGGWLRISPRPEGGTIVTCWIPAQADA